MSTKKHNKRGITRRDFIKWSAAAGAAAKAVDWAHVGPSMAAPTVKNTYRNICPYCSVGCGIKVDVDNATHDSGKIVDIYGDDTSVLSNGSLCSKGASLYQLADPDDSIGQNIKEPRIKIGDGTDGTWYRHPAGPEYGWRAIFGVDNWTDTTYADDIDMKEWEEIDTGPHSVSGVIISPSGVPGTGTIKTLPKSMKDSRDVDPDSVAFWGSAHLTNETCYLYRKLIAQFGTNNTEHCARI